MFPLFATNNNNDTGGKFVASVVDTGGGPFKFKSSPITQVLIIIIIINNLFTKTFIQTIAHTILYHFYIILQNWPFFRYSYFHIKMINL
jgi:hypothetical protein